MGDAQDEHDERFRLDLVKNAVVADAKAAQSLQVALQGRAPIGIVGQPVYGRSDARPFRPAQTLQFPGCAAA